MVFPTTTAEEPAQPTTAPSSPKDVGPQPHAGMRLTTINEYPSLGCHEADLSTLLHIDAPAETPSKRPPLVISASVDVSGSMQGEKIAMVLQALRFTIEQLTERDVFGVVTFAAVVKEVARPAFMTPAAKAQMLTIVDGLKANGGTDLLSGYKSSVDQLRSIQTDTSRRPNDADKAPKLPQGTLTVTHDYTRVLVNGAASHRYELKLTLTGVPSNRTVRLSVGGGLPIVTREVVCTPTASGAVSTTLQFDPQSAEVPAFDVSLHFQGAAANQAVTCRYPLVAGAEDGTRSFPFDIPAEVPTAIPYAAGAAGGVSALSVPMEAQRAVLLFTDGEATTGVTNAAEIVRNATHIHKGAGGNFAVHTFGFGGDINENVLRGIADVSQGCFYFVRTASSIVETFADCLGGLVSITASQIEVAVEPCSGFALEDLMTGYPVTKETPQKWRVSLRDLSAGEKRDMIVRVKRTGALTPSETPVACVTWTVTFLDVAAVERRTLSQAATTIIAATRYAGAPDVTFDEQRNRLAAAEVLKKARTETAEKARVMLTEVRTTMQGTTSAAQPAVQCLLQELDQVVGSTATTAIWRSEGVQAVAQKEQAHTRQRNNDAFGGLYDMPARGAMRMKAKGSSS